MLIEIVLKGCQRYIGKASRYIKMKAYAQFVCNFGKIPIMLSYKDYVLLPPSQNVGVGRVSQESQER